MRMWLLGVMSAAGLMAADAGAGWERRPALDRSRADVPRLSMLAAAQPVLRRPDAYTAWQIDHAEQMAVLKRAPMEFTEHAAPVLVLPRPDGEVEGFTVVESPVLHPDLAARFPQIRTYALTGIDNPAATARVTVSDLGLFATVISDEGSYAVAPMYTPAERTVLASRGVTTASALYVSSFVDDVTSDAWTCGAVGEGVVVPEAPGPSIFAVTGDRLRTYQLAVAVEANLCVNLAGGTVEGGLGAATTAVNAANAVWEREVAVRFQIFPENDRIIFTDPSNQPYVSSSNTSMLEENGFIIDERTDAAYDVGHVLAWTGGGVAYISSMCTGNKAGGVSGNIFSTSSLAAPSTFYHELGHQFGAGHSWNGANGSCSASQWSSTSAYEPGAGSTIMAYGGSCGVDNLAGNPRDLYFSQGSLQQITDLSAARACGVITNTGNRPPAVTTSIVNNTIIPIGTPFELVGAATDPDNHPLTFVWEQRDLGQRRALSAGDAGTGPLFRSFPPSATGNRRVFPRLSAILSGNLASSLGEILPTTTRSMRFRLTARDNVAGGGGQNFVDVTLRPQAAAGPFLITEPNTNIQSSGAVVVRWNVANTDRTPFNDRNVNILLSTDGGNTFPTVLASSVPNDGVHPVVLPQISATQARLRVQPVNRIYFDISNANFRISAAPNSARLGVGGPTVVADDFGDANRNGAADPGETAVRLRFDTLSTGLQTATNVRARLESLSSVVAVRVADMGFIDMPQGTLARSLTPAVVSIAPGAACGTSASLRLVLTADQGTWTLLYTLPIGRGSPAVCTPPAAFCPGDFNLDSVVDDRDFVIFANAYATMTDAGDLDGDTRTDMTDFVRFSAAYFELVCP